MSVCVWSGERERMRVKEDYDVRFYCLEFLELVNRLFPQSIQEALVGFLTLKRKRV